MTDLVDPQNIETIVGARRHPYRHIALADTATETVYILHASGCFHRGDGNDLRNCRYSLALDAGIDRDQWVGHEDAPTYVGLHLGRLVPQNQVEPAWRLKRGDRR